MKSLVNLVQEHGAEQLLLAMNRCEQIESNAQVVCSTAHRAKGREWRYVHLDADFEQGFLRAGRSGTGNPQVTQAAIDAESRLLCVGITRASHAVSFPEEINDASDSTTQRTSWWADEDRMGRRGKTAYGASCKAAGHNS